MNNLVPQINGLNIRQDVEGRFCLNDLHAAAGGEKRHSPNYFFELDRTKEFVSLLDSESRLPGSRYSSPMVSKRGYKGGTYVCEERKETLEKLLKTKFVSKLKLITA